MMIKELTDLRSLPIPERLEALARAGRKRQVNGFSFNDTQTVCTMLDEMAEALKGKQMGVQHQTNMVYRIPWTEYKRGWGARPDGATLHISLDEARKFIDEFWEAEKKLNPSGMAPDKYTKNDLDPTEDEIPIIEVEDEVYQNLLNQGSMLELVTVKS